MFGEKMKSQGFESYGGGLIRLEENNKYCITPPIQ